MKVLIFGKEKEIKGILRRYYYSSIEVCIYNNIICDSIVDIIRESTESSKIIITEKEKQLKELVNTSKFIKDYEEYRKDSKGMSRVNYFKELGYEGFENSKEFDKIYKNQISLYNGINLSIEEAEKEIFNELEITEFKRLWKEEEKRIEQVKKEAEEKVIKEQEEYLLPFKNGMQRCIFMVDENTHRMVNKEAEINLYLSFGYELNTDLTDKVKLVFLKPSAEYKYSPEFEQALISFRDAKKENRNTMFRMAY